MNYLYIGIVMNIYVQILPIHVLCSMLPETLATFLSSDGGDFAGNQTHQVFIH